MPLKVQTANPIENKSIIPFFKLILLLTATLYANSVPEAVNNGNRLLDDGASLRKYESFIYGGAVTLEAEGYLSDRIALLIRLRERFVWGGASGRCHFQYGAGVKYIF